jgi:RNA polymerase sigma factor (sigma-70 family)
LAAVPSIGRASLVEAPHIAPQAAATQGLYERHAAKIQSYCHHQLGSREEAEDAVQTTFMNAFRALGRGVVPEAESAWLFKIAENVCLSRRRSSWRRGKIESPSDFQVMEEIIPGPSRERDELIGIEEALASMPEQQRRAILLREWQGLSYREVAEELEVSQSAVETLIFRARRSLAQGLEQPDSIKPAKRKSFRRAAHVIDLGTIAAVLKTLLVGSAAVKATAAAVAVTAAVGTAATVAPKLEPQAPAKAAAVALVAPVPAAEKTPTSSPVSAPLAIASPLAPKPQPARAKAAPAAAAAAPAVQPVAAPEQVEAAAPAAEQPTVEATPPAAERTRATDEGKNDEGRKDEGQGKESAPGQQEESAQPPAEPQPVAAAPQETKRGGNSKGEGNSKKETPVLQAPGPITASVEQAKKEHGNGDEKRKLTVAPVPAPVVTAPPTPVVDAAQPAPVAEVAVAPAPEAAPVAEDKGRGDDKRNGKVK